MGRGGGGVLPASRGAPGSGAGVGLGSIWAYSPGRCPEKPCWTRYSGKNGSTAMETKIGFFFSFFFRSGKSPNPFMYVGIFGTKNCGAKQDVVAWGEGGERRKQPSSGTFLEGMENPGLVPCLWGVTPVSGHSLEGHPNSLHAPHSEPPGAVLWAFKKNTLQPLLASSSFTLRQHLLESLPQETRLLVASRTFLSLS